MKTLNLQSVVYKEGEYYVAQCLNVDVSSFGNTEPEALTNLKEALELYFEDMPDSNISDVAQAHLKSLTLQGA